MHMLPGGSRRRFVRATLSLGAQRRIPDDAGTTTVYCAGPDKGSRCCAAETSTTMGLRFVFAHTHANFKTSERVKQLVQYARLRRSGKRLDGQRLVREGSFVTLLSKASA